MLRSLLRGAKEAIGEVATSVWDAARPGSVPRSTSGPASRVPGPIPVSADPPRPPTRIPAPIRPRSEPPALTPPVDLPPEPDPEVPLTAQVTSVFERPFDPATRPVVSEATVRARVVRKPRAPKAQRGDQRDRHEGLNPYHDPYDLSMVEDRDERTRLARALWREQDLRARRTPISWENECRIVSVEDLREGEDACAHVTLPDGRRGLRFPSGRVFDLVTLEQVEGPL